jgi:hypothetical protein
MKYFLSWKPRRGGSPAEIEAAMKRALAMFSEWSAPEGVTRHQFLARLDAGGGYAVVETDDPKLVGEGPARFVPWFDFEVVPVVDLADALPVAEKAIAFRESVS